MGRQRQLPRTAKTYRERLWEQIERYERYFAELACQEKPELPSPADMREYRGLIKVDLTMFTEYLAEQRVRRLEQLFEKESERDLRARTSGASTAAEAGEPDRCH